MRSDKIFGLGNSEGTLHVLHYQRDHPGVPLAGLILAGPPGRAVGAVARSQLAAQAADFPNGSELLAWYDAAIKRFEAGEAAQPDRALPDAVKTFIAGLEFPANLPFSRELWTANAAPLLAKITGPVLVVIGKKDIQVDWQTDGEPLAAASRGKPNIRFAYPANANHVLKYESQDREQLRMEEVLPRYNADDARLDSEALGVILTWLSRQVSP